jgi:hypothetical protein
MSMNKIFDDIENFESQVKKKHPRNWRVKIQNAKSITDMEVDTDSTPGAIMKWNHCYLKNLKSQL